MDKNNRGEIFHGDELDRGEGLESIIIDLGVIFSLLTVLLLKGAKRRGG
jgi:hypothetical protein